MNMPTIVLENVPMEVYVHLQKRAARRQRSVPDELLSLLEQVLPREANHSSRLPDLIASEAIPVPFDLPRSSQPTRVAVYNGGPRLPDPWEENQE
jgi:plasmid stability protein